MGSALVLARFPRRPPAEGVLGGAVGGAAGAGSKLSQDVELAGDQLQPEPTRSLEHAFTPPQARGLAFCSCVPVTHWFRAVPLEWGDGPGPMFYPLFCSSFHSNVVMVWHILSKEAIFQTMDFKT